jgi:ABC-type nickel/cobalt efflux system permease component RcnA
VHPHDHDHDDPVHDHDHGCGPTHEHRSGSSAAGLRRRSVVLMGVAGGLVPTPSALVVLLGATALGRAWFGVVLVLAYGVGMSTALLVTGWVLVRLQARLATRLGGRPWWERAITVTPVLAAAALVGGGALLTARAVALL